MLPRETFSEAPSSERPYGTEFAKLNDSSGYSFSHGPRYHQLNGSAQVLVEAQQSFIGEEFFRNRKFLKFVTSALGSIG